MNNCRDFRLLLLTSLIGQFVHPVGGEGMGDIVILARYKYHFIRVHVNMVQHPSHKISI